MRKDRAAEPGFPVSFGFAMPSDGDDSDIFIMGPGVSAHRSMFSANAVDGAGGVSGSDDSLGMDDADTLANDAKRPKRRGRPPKAQGKGKAGKEKAEMRKKKREKNPGDSVFIVDDGDSESNTYEEDEDDVEVDALLASRGRSKGKGANDTVVEIVDLDADEPVAKVRKRANRRPSKRARRVELSEESQSEPDAEPEEETELQRRLRASITATRTAAEGFSDDKVAAEAQAEEQRRLKAAAAAAAAIAEEKSTQESLKRVTTHNADIGIIVLKVRCLGSPKAPLIVKMREEHLLGKLKPGVCKKFETQNDRAVLFHNGNVLSECESIGFQGIVSYSELELRISPDPVVSLKIRCNGDIAIPDICIRREDPIVCIYHLVCLKTLLTQQTVSLELDGEEIEECDTCTGLDVDSGTLVEARTRR